jgi:hypothetical protein
MRGQQVEIEQHLDHTLWMRRKQQRLQLDRCAAEKKANSTHYKRSHSSPLRSRLSQATSEMSAQFASLARITVSRNE